MSETRQPAVAVRGSLENMTASGAAPAAAALRTAPAACAEGDPGFAGRYRAIAARDTRFDGQFVTCVTSTGIYCRPSCPARTPRPGNVVFRRTPAAAHEAGFRACRRCLPEAVPGTPEWNLRSDVAARAMRLIADGVIDRAGVLGLADRLGFTPRHLTRLLTAELGAGPLALARAHRAQTARALAVATDLPLADIAFAAGFGSVRQFNDTVRAVFDTTPGVLRSRGTRQRSRATDSPHAGSAEHSTADALVRLTVALPVRAPFDAPGVFAFLAARAIPGVEVAAPPQPGRLEYARILALPHGPAVAEVVATAPHGTRVSAHDGAEPVPWTLQVHLALSSLADVPTAISRIRRMFDLDADPVAADAVLADDPLLAPLVARRPGIRVPGAVDPDELVIRAVIGQQISVAAARTHLGRLAACAGTPLSTDVPGLTTLFPTPAQIAEAVVPTPPAAALDPDRPLRLPRRSLRTVHALAASLAEGELSLHVGMDPAALREALLARPGIGPWTAAYTTMRMLGDPDVWLPGDAALAAAGRRLGIESGLDARSAHWAPWRSYAVVRLWQSQHEDPPPGRSAAPAERSPADFRTHPIPEDGS